MTGCTMKEKGLMGTSVPLRANHSFFALFPLLSRFFVHVHFCQRQGHLLDVALNAILSQSSFNVYQVSSCVQALTHTHSHTEDGSGQSLTPTTRAMTGRRKKDLSSLFARYWVLVFVLSWSILAKTKCSPSPSPSPFLYTHTCFTCVPLNDNFFHNKSIRHQRVREARRQLSDAREERRKSWTCFSLYCSLAINVTCLDSLFICNYIWPLLMDHFWWTISMSKWSVNHWTTK